MQRATALTFDQIAFGTAQGVVVQLDQIIADGFFRTAPTFLCGLFGHVLARAIDPFDLGLEPILQLVGAVA